MSSGDLNACF